MLLGKVCFFYVCIFVYVCLSFLYLRVKLYSFNSTKNNFFVSKIRLKPSVYLYVCFVISFAGGKTSYFSSITSFEKFADQNPMKLRQTNVYLWKSARTVLHLIYHFCSKDANQIGNTSSLLIHCLKQYPIINCTSNG